MGRVVATWVACDYVMASVLWTSVEGVMTKLTVQGRVAFAGMVVGAMMN